MIDRFRMAVKPRCIVACSAARRSGNEGVAGIIRSTEYTIGYVELAYAFQTGMSYAYVQNGDGTAFVEPTLDSISAASQNVAQALPEPSGDWSEVSLVNTPGDNSYPIASFTYLLVYDEISKTTKSKEQAQALIYMIYWMLTSGQSFSPDLQFMFQSLTNIAIAC